MGDRIKNLSSALAALGFGPILTDSATLVVLVEAEGRPLEWNPAFEIQKDRAPRGASLFDFTVPDQRTELDELLRPQDGRPVRQGYVEFPFGASGDQTGYDCLVFALPDNQFLFIARIAADANAFAAEYHLLQKELSETRHRLKKKEVELKAVLAQAEEVSHTDALTFLHNRRQILKLLHDEAHRSDRYKTPLTISMIDIDHFKDINDTFGHTEGDKVLVHLAKMLRECVREADAVGRYGGEEFLVLLPNTRLEEATGQAIRLCKFVRESALPVGKNAHLTISIGLAEYKPGKETWQKLLARADKALYKAKDAGRDGWATSK